MPISFEFLRPIFIAFVPLTILVLVLVFAFGRARKDALFVKWDGSKTEVRPLILRWSVAVLMFAAIFLAAAGPVLTGPEIKEKLKLIVVVDVSWSMAADDYPCPKALRDENNQCWEGSRYWRMTEDLEKLFARFPDVELHMLPFAGVPHPAGPKVTDPEPLLWILRNQKWMRPGLTYEHGSDLILALGRDFSCPLPEDLNRKCLGVLGLAEKYKDKESGKYEVVIVVLSDGTDLQDVSLLAGIAAEYRTRAIKVVSIGYGNAAKDIRVPRSLLVEDEMEENSKEKEYVTLRANFNPAPLEFLAKETGGEYRHSVTGSELTDIFVTRADLKYRKIELGVAKDFHRVFAAAAATLFVLSFFLMV